MREKKRAFQNKKTTQKRKERTVIASFKTKKIEMQLKREIKKLNMQLRESEKSTNKWKKRFQREIEKNKPVSPPEKRAQEIFSQGKEAIMKNLVFGEV